MIYLLAAIVIWVASALLTVAIWVGDCSGSFPRIFSREHYRDDLARSLFIGLIPILSPLVYFFLTGFAQHGLALTYKQALAIKDKRLKQEWEEAQPK